VADSVDHKKIGVMYIIVAMVMLLRGFADAIMMRTQLAAAPVAPKATCRLNTMTRSSPLTV
jgi:heme/copper-type cytochrome/quinol oxidase subunit 1